jgi:lysozyme
MNKPNITKNEIMVLISSAKDNIAAALKRYMDAGRLSKEEADKYLETASIPHKGSVIAIGIRGYYKNTMGKQGENDRGIFDDAIILIGPNYYKTFNANTDPRIIKAGVGMLLPGWHLFKQGWHGYGKASGHQAFRTANAKEILPVLRDGMVGIQQGVTINIHKGGQYNTNSIACQTIIADQWAEFKKDAYKLMNTEGQKVLPYLLLENI